MSALPKTLLIKWKGVPQNRRIYCKTLSDEELVSKVYEELWKLNHKNVQNNPIKNGEKVWTDISETAKKHMKRCSTANVIMNYKVKQWDTTASLHMWLKLKHSQHQMLMKMRSNRSSHSLMVGIQKGTDGGNTEWYRWWEYGIRKGADGGNMEWYRWWEYRMVQMVGIQKGTDGGNTEWYRCGNMEWYRWWEYGMVQMVGIQKGADGGNMEWYRWWEYRKVQMVGIQNGTVKLEHSWAVSHKAEPNLPSNLTTVSPGTQPNELNVCSHKTRR